MRSDGEYRRGFSMESREKSCRTKSTTLPYTYEADHADRRDVVPSGYPLCVCHCTLAYISLMGKSRVLQLRRSDDGRFEENCNGSFLSLSLSFSLSFSSFLSTALHRALSYS